MARAHQPDEASLVSILSDLIGRPIVNARLLRIALTHASAVHAAPGETYERLEFLGDRVLGLIMAEFVYRTFTREAEGALARRYNALVDRGACVRAARRANLEPFISAARPRKGGPAPLPDVILADVCEAVLGFLYLEGGLPAARAFVEAYWADELSADINPSASPKNRIQEWAFARKRREPVYEVISCEGPDHSPRFVVEATVEGVDPARGEGSSRREAERAAAAALLKSVGVDD